MNVYDTAIDEMIGHLQQLKGDHSITDVKFEDRVGLDDIPSMDGFRHRELNGTRTITLRINGGAVDNVRQ